MRESFNQYICLITQFSW